MINIKIELDLNGNIKCIFADGHAGYNEKGKDVVCAGVSTLIQTIDLAFHKIPSIDFNVFDDENYLLRVNSYNQEVSGEIRGITIFLITGLKVISNEYKDKVKLNIIRS